MTRINTNVSSLVARNTLGRSNAALEQALTRLSTGLRINTGKDDPAGLIASENLRSDITSIQRAISNTDRANQVIATADSALGQVSSLLNDIRGLVTESANAGALSDAQISANQLQVDSSLEALNRIAQTTTFQGRRLLDGSLDFVTGSSDTDFANVQSLKIDQANLGATGSVSVSLNVSTAATQAQVDVASVPTGSGSGVAASTTVTLPTLSGSYTASTGQIDFTVQTGAAQASSGTINLTLNADDATAAFTGFTDNANIAGALNLASAGAYGGANGNNLTIAFAENNASTSSTSSLSGDVLTITVGTDDGGADNTPIAFDTIFTDLAANDATFQAIFNYTSGDITGGNYTPGDTTAGISFSGGRDADTAAITVTGAAVGTSGNVDITIVEANGIGATPSVSGDAINGYTVTIDDSIDTSVSAIVTAIDGISEVGATSSDGAKNFRGSVDSAPAALSLTNGSAATTATQSIDLSGLATSAGGDVSFTFASGGTNGIASNGSGAYTITLTSSATLDDVVTLLNNGTVTEFSTSAASLHTGATGTNVITTSPSSAVSTTGYAAPTSTNNVITITNDTVGTAGNSKTVTLSETSTSSLFNATTHVGAAVDGNGNITVSLDSAATSIAVSDIVDAINNLTGYSATLTSGTGSNAYDSTSQTPPSASTTANGAPAGGLADAVVFELAGATGSEVLSFGAGTSITQLVDGINLVKDATGVEASANGTTLELKSTGYGTTSLVDLKVISEGTGSTPSGIFSSVSTKRDTGTDIVATVNGIAANGTGNTLQINTATLDLTSTIDPSFTGQIDFTISGGGALFQLGPDVVSNQQARLGIGSVNTARLGGVSGKLFQLGTGNSAALGTDPTTAASIVEEAIDQVTSLRGRLGAFQRTTLETNKNALNDTLTNLTEAESSIRDADFAAESAQLTRAQILVQSGTTVLQIANQNPQNVLALLRG